MPDDLELSVEQQSIDIGPGASMSLTAVVVNGTATDRRLLVTALGNLAEWAAVQPSTLELAPGGRAEFDVTVTPPITTPVGIGGVLGIRVADPADVMVSRVEEIRISVVAPAAPPPPPPPPEPTIERPRIDDTVAMPPTAPSRPPSAPAPSAPPPAPPPAPRPAAPRGGEPRPPRGDIRVSIAPPIVSISPGGTAVMDVRVFNATDIVDEFTMAPIGLDDEYLTADPPRLSLFPGKEATARVVISLPEGAALVSGSHTVGLKVTSVTNPAVTRVEEFQLDVQAVQGAVLTLEPQTIRAGGRARLTAHIANNGNLPLDVSLQGTDAEQAITFQFQPQHLVVPPFSSGSTRIRMRAPRPWTGRPQPRMFEVRSGDAFAAGTIIQRPRVPPFVVRLVTAVLGLGALAGIALSIPSVRESVFPPSTTTTLPPTAAVITSFGPVGEVSADGCTTFEWDVDEAVEVTLKTPRRELDVPAQGSQELCGADGDVFVLEAVGEDGQVDDRSHTLGVDLLVEGVDARIQGRTVIFDVSTNQASDVNIALIGRAVDKTSSGRSSHHIEFDAQESGQIEWRLTASLPGKGDVIETGSIAIPFYSVRVSVVSEPTFTPNAPPPTVGLGTVTGDAAIFEQDVTFLEFVTIDIDPTFLVPTSYWFPYAAQPVPRFIGDDCPGQYAGQRVDELILPLEEDGSAEVSFNVDLCSGFAGFVQPLPEDPVTAQPIKIAPGFDELAGERELVFPVNDGFQSGTVSLVVRVERITTPDRPDYP